MDAGYNSVDGTRGVSVMVAQRRPEYDPGYNPPVAYGRGVD